MTTTKQYDLLNRVTNIANVPSADSTVSFAYQYTNANQRTRITESIARSRPQGGVLCILLKARGYRSLLERSTTNQCDPRSARSREMINNWLSRDPMEEDGGINVFAFALNAPHNLIDSDGLEPQNWTAGEYIRQATSAQNNHLAHPYEKQAMSLFVPRTPLDKL